MHDKFDSSECSDDIMTSSSENVPAFAWLNNTGHTLTTRLYNITYFCFNSFNSLRHPYNESYKSFFDLCISSD